MTQKPANYADAKTPQPLCPFRHIIAPQTTLDPRQLNITMVDVPCARDLCQLWRSGAHDCALTIIAEAMTKLAALTADAVATLLAVLDELKP